MLKLLFGWVLLSCSPFIMLLATYENQAPLVAGFGLLLLGAWVMDVEFKWRSFN